MMSRWWSMWRSRLRIQIGCSLLLGVLWNFLER